MVPNHDGDTVCEAAVTGVSNKRVQEQSEGREDGKEYKKKQHTLVYARCFALAFYYLITRHTAKS
jgi:hypothetical protein